MNEAFSFPTQNLHFLHKWPKKFGVSEKMYYICTVRGEKSEPLELKFMGRKKQIRLNFAQNAELIKEGKCEIFDLELEPARRYSIYGIDGYRVWVHSVDNGFAMLSLEEPEEKELRAVKLLTSTPEGAFIGGRTRFEEGDMLIVKEAYCVIWERLKENSGEDDAVEFLHKVADAHGVEPIRAKIVAGWYNADKVLPELMPRKVVVTEVAVLPVQSIVDADWRSIGVRWVNAGFAELQKREYVGRDRWNANKEVILYRYKESEE